MKKRSAWKFSKISFIGNRGETALVSVLAVAFPGLSPSVDNPYPFDSKKQKSKKGKRKTFEV